MQTVATVTRTDALRAAAVADQAARLAEHVRRGGDPDRWLDSKFFSPADRAAIYAAWCRQREGAAA